MKKILILNGPNLNLLGTREPELYGRVSFDDYFSRLKALFSDSSLDYFQTNHEGVLIDKLQEAEKALLPFPLKPFFLLGRKFLLRKK